MSQAFESIQQGLREAIEFAEGKPSKAIVNEVSPMEVKAISETAGARPAEFDEEPVHPQRKLFPKP
jgi:putative transcriptional regulator